MYGLRMDRIMVKYIKGEKRTKRYYATIVPVLAVMIIIFMFSARTAEESGQDSSKVVELLKSIYEWMTEKGFPQLSVDFPVSLIVRKLAHFSEYCLLAICVMLHLFEYKLKNRYRFIIAAVFCSVYAMTDEFHQLFVPGRGGAVTDVLIDSCGAVVGAALAGTLAKLYRTSKNRSRQKNVYIKEANSESV